MKVQILTNMVAPYRNPFFAAIAKKVDLDVCFNVLSEPGRNWKVDLDSLGYRHHILGEKGIEYKRTREDLEYTETRSIHWGGGAYKELQRNAPEYIVSLEFGARSILALVYGALKRVPVLLWWEGTLHTEKEVSFIKRLLRRLMVKRFSGYWVNGKESANYVRTLGGSHNIQEHMTGVDTNGFYQSYITNLPTRDAMREELGLKGVCFLYSGSLSGRKGMREYIAAIKGFVKGLDSDVTFLFVGGGEYQDEIEALSSLSGYLNIVCTGFVQQSDLPKYYTVADIFVLPTLDDNWPLATLEGSVFGLPQVFSKYNGASADLCESDEDGWVIDPLDEVAFVKALQQGEKRGYNRVSKERTESLVRLYSPESFAERAVESFNKTS